MTESQEGRRLDSWASPLGKDHPAALPDDEHHCWTPVSQKYVVIERRHRHLGVVAGAAAYPNGHLPF